jgi:hypothetical protein
MLNTFIKILIADGAPPAAVVKALRGLEFHGFTPEEISARISELGLEPVVEAFPAVEEIPDTLAPPEPPPVAPEAPITTDEVVA